MRTLVALLGQIVFFGSISCNVGYNGCGGGAYRTNNGKRQLIDYSLMFNPTSYGAGGNIYPPSFLPMAAPYKRAFTSFDRFPEFEALAKSFNYEPTQIVNQHHQHNYEPITLAPIRREVLFPAKAEDSTKEFSNPLAATHQEFEHQPLIQEYKHSEQHKHKHAEEHKHKHGEEHKHKHQHEEKHEHGHKEEGLHKHAHEDVEHHHHEHRHIQHHHHLHKHVDDHKHKHAAEHKHEHKHKEGHKHEEKHIHKHGHEEKHEEKHKHEHKHEQHHKHEQKHKHEEKHESSQEYFAPSSKEEYYYKYLGQRPKDLAGERSQQAHHYQYITTGDLAQEPSEILITPTLPSLNLRSPQMFPSVQQEHYISGI